MKTEINIKTCIQRHLLFFLEDEFSLGDDVTDNDWYLANINAYGFFIVTYDVDNWSLLSRQLQSDHEVLKKASVNTAFPTYQKQL